MRSSDPNLGGPSSRTDPPTNAGIIRRFLIFWTVSDGDSGGTEGSNKWPGARLLNLGQRYLKVASAMGCFHETRSSVGRPARIAALFVVFTHYALAVPDSRRLAISLEDFLHFR